MKEILAKYPGLRSEIATAMWGQYGSKERVRMWKCLNGQRNISEDEQQKIQAFFKSLSRDLQKSLENPA